MSEINDQYIIQKSSLKDIADAIREMKMYDDKLTPEDMPDEIKSIHTGTDLDCSVTVGWNREAWTRPEGWPNLDIISIPDDFDGVYMTYDLTKTRGYGWIGVYAQMSVANSKYYVERGHIEGTAFVADYSVEVAKGTFYREPLDETNGLVQLWRVYSTGHITRFGLCTNSAVSTETMYNKSQPMVERRGYLPYVTDLSSSLSSNTTYITFNTFWLEKDNVVVGSQGVVITLNAMYAQSYHLVSVNLNWNTSNWNPTSIGAMFQDCYLLKNIDFASWDTSNWVRLNNLANMFDNCRRLETIDLHYWNTENWVVKTINRIFYNCMSLKTIIGLDSWDTSNWQVTTLADFFNSCISLDEIDIPSWGWDTTNWAVTSLSYMFGYCYRIKKIDLSCWDTSSWVVTTIGSMFRECYSLLEVNLEMDTSNWNVTSMAYAFAYCGSLVDLDLSSWDTSNWHNNSISNLFLYCTNLKHLSVPFDTTNWFSATKDNSTASAFQNCKSLVELDLRTWDTSNWLLDLAQNMFDSCHILEEIKEISSWNTSTWRLTNISAMFNRCYCLKELDFRTWDTSNWAVTNVSSMFCYCRMLQEIKGIEDWDTSNWQLTTFSYFIEYCASLRELDLSKWDTTNWNLTSVYYFADSTNGSLSKIKLPSTMSMVNATNTNYVNIEAMTLEECTYYPTTINTYLRYANAPLISRASLLSLINALPTIATTKTLTLQQGNRMKLTAAEIAIATQKGWTVV